MASGAEFPAQPFAEIAFEKDSSVFIREAILERWTNQRYEACAERWQGMLGQLPDTIRALSIVPVSLNDEPVFNIERLMEQYGKQTMPPEQWGALLSLNCAGDINEDKVMAMLDTIDQARLKYPRLNVASCVIAYEEPQAISRIRSDIWDVALFELFAKQITHEVVGISHDADTWYMPADHISEWVKTVEADARFCYGGYTGFNTVGAERTLGNKYLQFINALRELYTDRGLIHFEGNMAMSLNQYAAANDWGEADVAEGMTLLENFNFMRDGRPSDKKDYNDIFRWYRVPRAEAIGVEASPRRVLHSFFNDAEEMNYSNFTEGNNQERRMSMDALSELTERVTVKQVYEAVMRTSRGAIGELEPFDIATVHAIFRYLSAKKTEIGIYDNNTEDIS